MSTETLASSPAAGPPLGLKDFFNALSRRRVVAIAVAAVCVVIALTIAFVLPAQYRAGSTILIEQQEVPTEFVRSSVTSYAAQRLQMINQRVMTSQNLLDIIRRYSLYPERQGKDPREQLVRRMREDIALKMIDADVIDPRSGSPQKATIAFSVSYTSRDPAHAVKVANELTSLYLSENLTERTRLASNATSFLNEESQRLSKQIEETEKKLAAFKEKHADSMPELESLNRSLLDRTEQELRGAQMRSMFLEQQRVYLESQLAEVRPSSLTTDSGQRVLTPQDRLRILKSQLSSTKAAYGPEHPDIARIEREIHGLEAEVGASGSAPASANELQRSLDDARAKLAQARDRYSEDHPDVQRLERTVAGLEADLKKAADSPAPVANAKPTEAPDNPAYIQLQTQLAQTQTEQEGLKTRMEQLRAQSSDYERKLALAPGVENEYRDLRRDYESGTAKYAELRNKQMEAQLAQNLETDRKGERFTVIEPPTAPEQPVSPNRPAIMALGTVLATGITFALVLVLEKLDPSVRGHNDLMHLLATAPLAVLPWIETEEDRRLRKRRRRYAMVGALASVVLSIGIVHLFFRPLDVLWEAVLRRVGSL